MSHFQRNTYLYSLLAMKYRDEVALQSACEAVMRDPRGLNMQTLTNFLYILAKFKFQPDLPQDPKNGRNPFMNFVADLLLKEPALSIEHAARNLWNMYALEHYDEKLFDKLGKVFVKNHDQLGEVDVANAFRAFAHFKHTHTEQAAETLESLVRTSIRNLTEWNVQTIAVVCNSLAELDINN